jgi:hypothetical protein
MLRTYTFEETGEALPYAVFVSSKVKPGEKAPLIDVELTANSSLLDIPVMLAVGDQDTLAEGTKGFSERQEALNAEAGYKLYAGLDHGTIILGSMPEVLRFFGEHAQ